MPRVPVYRTVLALAGLLLLSACATTMTTDPDDEAAQQALSRSAWAAPGRPASAIAFKRGLRAETTASSDRAKRPLTAIRQAATTSSST